MNTMRGGRIVAPLVPAMIAASIGPISNAAGRRAISSAVDEYRWKARAAERPLHRPRLAGEQFRLGDGCMLGPSMLAGFDSSSPVLSGGHYRVKAAAQIASNTERR